MENEMIVWRFVNEKMMIVSSLVSWEIMIVRRFVNERMMIVSSLVG